MLSLVLRSSTRQHYHYVSAFSTFRTIRRTNAAVRIALVRHLSSSSTNSDAPSYFKDDEKNKKQQQQQKKKYKFNEKATSAEQSARLAAAFDELAQKEGFELTEAHFAKHATFEDDFDDELDLDADDREWNDDDDDNDDLRIDFDNDTNEEDFAEFNTASSDGSAASMAERIAAAQRDVDQGRVTVPRELDRRQYAAKIAAEKDVVTPQTMRELGFRRELDPFEGDETPRKQRFQLVTDAMVCTACGSDFQAHDETKPGYIPIEKFEVQQKLHKIEELRHLQEKQEWSPDDEIDWLIQTQGKTGGGTVDRLQLLERDLDQMAEEMDIDLDELHGKPVVCKRCHGLQNHGKVDASLRPGWSEDPMMAQERFRALLRPIGERNAVIIALVDLFDFAGSVLPELDGIAGTNPVIIAANKADLMPDKMGPVRVENWVRRELEYMGVQSLANVGGAVRLISCKTGKGVFDMLDKARGLAEEMECDIYVVGAANAGKSTLLNYILRKEKERNELRRSKKKKRRAGNRNESKGMVTASPLPGTTLKFIKVNLEGGQALYDTPGLLVPGTLTQILTPEELKLVVPKKKVEPVTFRVAAGKCVLIGGLARISVVGDSRPFFLTFFVGNDIKLHVTDQSRADDFRKKHAGELLTPPLPPGEQRIEDIGEFENHNLEVEGVGWKEAAADITLTGLGWVAVTGAGNVQLEVSVPKGVAVTMRPPLMPWDIMDTTAKFTGGKITRKHKKGRSGVGRR